MSSCVHTHVHRQRDTHTHTRTHTTRKCYYGGTHNNADRRSPPLPARATFVGRRRRIGSKQTTSATGTTADTPGRRTAVATKTQAREWAVTRTRNGTWRAEQAVDSASCGCRVTARDTAEVSTSARQPTTAATGVTGRQCKATADPTEATEGEWVTRWSSKSSRAATSPDAVATSRTVRSCTATTKTTPTKSPAHGAASNRRSADRRVRRLRSSLATNGTASPATAGATTAVGEQQAAGLAR